MNTPLHEIARFPVTGDNAAIALADLKAGTCIQNGDTTFNLQHDILTGHRFAAVQIKQGDLITSWNYPFGTASRLIEAGEYLCNVNVLFRLSIQEDPLYTELTLPKEANFTDDITPYSFRESEWVAPKAIEPSDNTQMFSGYDRGNRGSGTRNHLVIINTSATNAPLVERLETIFKDRVNEFEHVDAIVGLRHTESASEDREEHDRTLRTLAGLISNPNVGGFIAIDSGLDGDLSNAELMDWMRAHKIPFESMRYELQSASDSFESDLQHASDTIERMLNTLNTDRRSPRPLSHLKIGLQCGASDAFSGICGNVLSGAIGREVIRHGGVANLTETPELSGAEDYTLSSIAKPEIAIRFLAMLDRFKTYLSWHGGKVDKNPSEGNLLGGLYNITLKSLGAAVKRDPEIPIQHIIEYGERMDQPGFYFMDGMGGDIASYTGQAAAGCNIVLFVTGRGSPTNSSIVPTVKIVNTTRRYKLMEGDIDINAGVYLEGKSMETLTHESLQQVLQIAGGARTKGEKRNQNIDLLWRRKFFETKPDRSADVLATRFTGIAHPCQKPTGPALEFRFEGRKAKGQILPKEKVGLIIPTVGCSLATAQQAAQRLNQSSWIQSGRITRFAVLANTEGCGVTTGSEVLNFILSYANHPQVEACLFLSLGCEMVSPGFIKSAMRGDDIGFPEITAAAKKYQLSPDRYGWITIQDAGGTERALTAAENWFAKTLQQSSQSTPSMGEAQNMRVGVLATGFINEAAQASVAEYVRQIVASGGSVVIPESSTLLQRADIFSQFPIEPSLAFAQAIDHPGLHVMQSITDNRIEQVTGLGAATDVILNFSETRPITAHTLIPTLNISTASVRGDFDFHLKPEQNDRWPQQLADLTCHVLSGSYQPRQNMLGHTGNQIPRGPRAHAI